MLLPVSLELATYLYKYLVLDAYGPVFAHLNLFYSLLFLFLIMFLPGAMARYHAHGATDVTGFGIFGHAGNLAKAQDAAVSFELDVLPVLRGTPAINATVDFGLLTGLSAETSGGLLVALAVSGLGDG